MSIHRFVCVLRLKYIKRGVEMKGYMEIIRGLREDKDLKQTEVANVIGTTQQHYSKYETGEYELPLRALAVLADYYNVSADYLMGRTDCREGVAGLNEKLYADHSVGALISDVLSLNEDGRKAVLEYISLQKMKETCAKKK